MPDGTLERSYGKVFDQVADEYDRHRPTYPDALLDHACEVAALCAGDRVLEIGCGPGQLTRALLARGLRVSAIEPGDRLIALARRLTSSTRCSARCRSGCDSHRSNAKPSSTRAGPSTSDSVGRSAPAPSPVL